MWLSIRQLGLWYMIEELRVFGVSQLSICLCVCVCMVHCPVDAGHFWHIKKSFIRRAWLSKPSTYYRKMERFLNLSQWQQTAKTHIHIRSWCYEKGSLIQFVSPISESKRLWKCSFGINEYKVMNSFEGPLGFLKLQVIFLCRHTMQGIALWNVGSWCLYFTLQFGGALFSKM